jgi:hypothetical protein
MYVNQFWPKGVADGESPSYREQGCAASALRTAWKLRLEKKRKLLQDHITDLGTLTYRREEGIT